MCILSGVQIAKATLNLVPKLVEQEGSSKLIMNEE